MTNVLIGPRLRPQNFYVPAKNVKMPKGTFQSLQSNFTNRQLKSILKNQGYDATKNFSTNIKALYKLLADSSFKSDYTAPNVLKHFGMPLKKQRPNIATTVNADPNEELKVEANNPLTFTNKNKPDPTKGIDKEDILHMV